MHCCSLTYKEDMLVLFVFRQHSFLVYITCRIKLITYFVVILFIFTVSYLVHLILCIYVFIRM